MYIQKYIIRGFVMTVLLLSGCSDSSDSIANPPGNVLGQRQMVATADVRASQAALDMLRAGGNAVDAAVAAQMVLGLVEPQSCGIGGGAFLVLYDPQENKVTTFDSRETAPATATADRFQLSDGSAMAFYDRVLSGRSVGTPGVLKMLRLVHSRYGVLPWGALFTPAIALARDGFAISPRLYNSLQTEANKGRFTDSTALNYFYQADGRTPKPIGTILKNPELQTTLQAIADQGPDDAFYRGDVAQAIVNKVANNPSLGLVGKTPMTTNPGLLSMNDLANYQAKERTPLCFSHTVNAIAPAGGGRVYKVCGMGPPSSGPLAVGQIMGILARTPQAHAQWVVGTNGSPALPDAAFLHTYSEASRLAFADRAQYVADPDFVADNYSAGLLSGAYLQGRAALISPTSRIDTPMPGTLPVAVGAKHLRKTVRYAQGTDQPEHGTSHLSLIDPSGLAVSMTTTVEDAFGSRMMVRGFMLNNQLTDFEAIPTAADGTPKANRVQGGKRPRSSMSPVIVFEPGRSSGPSMIVGSPGGSFIIHYVTKTLWGQMSQGLAPRQAIEVPNFSTTGITASAALSLEKGKFPVATLDTLSQLYGYYRQPDGTLLPLVIDSQDLIDTPSGIQSIRRLDGAGPWILQGASDPRREGVVLAD